MSSAGSGAPPWLFSFVDLAFLLLIAMTQLGADGNPGAPVLGEIVVPRIESESASDMPTDARMLWQLRVHPDGADGRPPFELVQTEGLTETAVTSRLDESALRAQLVALHAERESRPLLAPHEDSRSSDLLTAVGLVEEIWPGRRRAIIETALSTR